VEPGDVKQRIGLLGSSDDPALVLEEVRSSHPAIRRCALLAASRLGLAGALDEAREMATSEHMDDRLAAYFPLARLGDGKDRGLVTSAFSRMPLEKMGALAEALAGLPKEQAGEACIEGLHHLAGEKRGWHLQKAAWHLERCLRIVFEHDPGLDWEAMRDPEDVGRRWRGLLEEGRPPPSVTRTALSEWSAVATVRGGTGRIRMEDCGAPYVSSDGEVSVSAWIVSFWIGRLKAASVRVACGTCPILLQSSNEERVREVSRAFSTLPPASLLFDPALDDLLKELRSGTFRLYALRLLLEPIDRGTSDLEFMMDGADLSGLLWEKPAGGKPPVVVRTLQERESLNEETVERYASLPAGDRGTVVAYASPESRTWGPSGHTASMLALIVLDGHHKLAASVEAGEPCSLLAVVETRPGQDMDELLEFAASPP
jgi:hypothetical protein